MSTETLLGPAFHLRIGCQVSSESQWKVQDMLDQELLLDTLEEVSPVHAQLWVEVGGEPEYILWERLGKAAPRLRFLELKITPGILGVLHGEESDDGPWTWLVRASVVRPSVPPLSFDPCAPGWDTQCAMHYAACLSAPAFHEDTSISRFGRG